MKFNSTFVDVYYILRYIIYITNILTQRNRFESRKQITIQYTNNIFEYFSIEYG